MPSGTGIRIIGRADGERAYRKIKVSAANGVSCEIYRQCERYITVTGNAIADPPLAEIDAQVDAVITEVDQRREIIGDPTIADAILDRLVHNAHRLTLKGESLRKTAAKH
jgi:primase-polymerase (primpol)-like protein